MKRHGQKVLAAFVGDLKALAGMVYSRDDRSRPKLTRTRYGFDTRRLKVG
jgi:hypothetical protein